MKKPILLCLLLAACSSSGGNNPPPPQIQGWTALYSTGIGACDDFNFGELHYCVRQMNARIGQTIRMTFTISGSGQLYPVERTDLPPASLRLSGSTDVVIRLYVSCAWGESKLSGSHDFPMPRVY